MKIEVKNISVLKKGDNLFKVYYTIKNKKRASIEIFVQESDENRFETNLKFDNHECHETINLMDSSDKEVMWSELMGADISSKSRFGLINDVWTVLETAVEKIKNEDFSEMDDAEKKKEGVEGLSVNELIQHVAKEMINEYHIKTASDTEEIFIFKNNHYTNPLGYIKKIIADKLDLYRDSWHPRLVPQILNTIKSRTMVSRDVFNANHDFIPCKNGYLEIKTGKLHIPNPDLIYTWQLPVKFNDKARCPKTEKILLDILGPAYVETFWEYAGYCLYNRTIKKSSLVLYGTHNTGKTTAANILRTFLGDKNVVSNELKALSEDRWAPATLFGKLCNIATEMSPKAIKDDTMFKAITDGNPIQAEKKGVQPFTFTPTCKLMFACNQLPPVMNASSAYYERLNLIECTNEFPSNSDPAVKDGDWVTENEMSGMLNHAIVGLTRIRMNKKFSHVKLWKDTQMEYLKQSSPVDYFIEMAIEFDAKATSKTNQEIYAYYEKFCKAHNFEPVSYQTFVAPRGGWKRNFGSTEFTGRKGNLATTRFIKFIWDESKQEEQSKVTQPTKPIPPVNLPHKSSIKPKPITPYDNIKIIDEKNPERDWLDKFSEEYIQEQYNISQMTPDEYYDSIEEDRIYAERMAEEEMIEELGSIEDYNIYLRSQRQAEQEEDQ